MVSEAGSQEVGLIFGSARESFSRLSVRPESESFTSCALPPSLEATGMCLCFGTVVQKVVLAKGTVRKSVSAVSHQSSVISRGPRVSDPMLEVGVAVVPGTSPPPPGVPRHARTSIPRVVPFRQARYLFARGTKDLPGTKASPWFLENARNRHDRPRFQSSTPEYMRKMQRSFREPPLKLGEKATWCSSDKEISVKTGERLSPVSLVLSPIFSSSVPALNWPSGC